MTLKIEIEEILRDIATEASLRVECKEIEAHDEYYYFDPLLGRPMATSTRFNSLVAGQVDGINYEDILIVLFERFPLDLSPKLRHGPSPRVTWELFEYERLLACASDRLPSNCHSERSQFTRHHCDALMIVSSMACDIFHLLENFKTTTVNNSIPLLTLLVRCLHHAIRFHQYATETASMDEHQRQKCEPKVLGMGLLVAASFTSPPFYYNNDDIFANLASKTHSATYLAAVQIFPSLNKQLSLAYAVDIYCDPRFNFTAHCNSGFWEKPVINTHDNALEIPWGKSDVLCRCATSLAQTCCCLLDTNHGTADCADGLTFRNRFTCKDSITLTMAQMCRAHFFGRLFSSSNSTLETVTQQTTTRTRYPSGVHTPKPVVISDSLEEPRRLSQLLGPLRIFSMLAAMTDGTSSSTSTSILVEGLPLAYSLLDHWDGKYQTLGGALCLSLFCCGNQLNGPLQEEKINDNLAEQVLSRAIRTCRDPVALTVMSMAHCNVVRIQSRTNRQALQAACKGWIQKAATTYGGGADSTSSTESRSIVPGLLVGAILPLLSHLAVWNCENANALEISKEGLGLFLPTLRAYSPIYDGTTESIRTIATMLTLITLLMGSWPVADTYSGQILCSLLTVIGRAERQDLEKNVSSTVKEQHTQHQHAVSELAKHVASIAVIICGEAAQQVLTIVEHETTSLTRACKEIRLKAQTLDRSIKLD